MIATTVGALYDRAVTFHGKRTAITMGRTSQTYAELGQTALTIACGLQKRGVVKGETIGFLMANCPEYPACEYAVAKIGAVRVPLASLLANDDHIYMMDLTDCTTLIYHEKFADRVAQMVPALKTVKRFIVIGSSHENLPGHETLTEVANVANPHLVPVEIDPEDLCGIYFTGGTTGRPKGVMLSHRSWIYTYMMELVELRIGWHENFLFVSPLTHASGCLILPVLLRGGCCVILDHFDAELFFQTVQKEKITSTFLVPTMIYMLLDFERRDALDFSSLTNIIYGAAPMALDRLRQAMAFFGPYFTQLFGQTEAPMSLTALSQEDHCQTDPARESQVLTSAGRPTYHTTIRLLDDNGREVPQGDEGEIVVSCPNMMSGYFKNEEATREAIRDGWLHTGDVGVFDEEGFLYIVDRKKDMIITGGFNVYPREIEDVLHAHASIRNVAVVGIPHDKWGEEVVGVVELHEAAEATEEELIAFVRAQKGSLVSPKRVAFWETVPLTNLGKIDKKKIRARLVEM